MRLLFVLVGFFASNFFILDIQGVRELKLRESFFRFYNMTDLRLENNLWSHLIDPMTSFGGSYRGCCPVLTFLLSSDLGTLNESHSSSTVYRRSVEHLVTRYYEYMVTKFSPPEGTYLSKGFF